MAKLVRNTVFTIVVLALTAVGLNWNKSVVRNDDPIHISDTVLSSFSNESQHMFPLTIKFGQTNLKLGQYQDMEIFTQANALLQIVTIYPDGSIDNSQTRRAAADETGRYSMKFRLDDFTQLGVFQTKILAQSGNQESQTSGSFVLRHWAEPNKVLENYAPSYPLVP